MYMPRTVPPSGDHSYADTIPTIYSGYAWCSGFPMLEASPLRGWQLREDENIVEIKLALVREAERKGSESGRWIQGVQRLSPGWSLSSSDELVKRRRIASQLDRTETVEWTRSHETFGRVDCAVSRESRSDRLGGEVGISSTERIARSES